MLKDPTYKRLYHVWKGIKYRCYNPKSEAYGNYGGRGIGVCERWRQGYRPFYEDMAPTYKPGLQIDRIDNDGDYSPDNCRWVTPKENSRNRSNCHFIDTPKGRMTIAEACEIAQVSHSAMRERVRRGWSTEYLLKTPLGVATSIYNQRLSTFSRSSSPSEHTLPHIIQTPDGELNIRDAALRAGVTYACMKYRASSNWSPERLFDPPRAGGPHSHKMIHTPEGEITAKEAARRAGVTRSSILRRVRDNWPVEHILDPPLPHKQRCQKLLFP